MLSVFQAAPREGHLHQVFHIFAFMKKNPKLTIYLIQDSPIYIPRHFQGVQKNNLENNIKMK